MRRPCHFQSGPTCLSEPFGNTDIYLFMISLSNIKIHRLRADRRFLIGFAGTEDEDEACPLLNLLSGSS